MSYRNAFELNSLIQYTVLKPTVSLILGNFISGCKRTRLQKQLQKCQNPIFTYQYTKVFEYQLHSLDIAVLFIIPVVISHNIKLTKPKDHDWIYITNILEQTSSALKLQSQVIFCFLNQSCHDLIIIQTVKLVFASIRKI